MTSVNVVVNLQTATMTYSGTDRAMAYLETERTIAYSGTDRAIAYLETEKNDGLLWDGQSYGLLGDGKKRRSTLGWTELRPAWRRKELRPPVPSVLPVSVISPPLLEIYIVYGAGIACWSKRRTHDRKVASSNLGRSGARIFFSRINFVC